jgi:hypothetical protein
MAIQWKRRFRAAQIAVRQGRVETVDERHDRETNEAAAESAKWLKKQVAEAPLNCWFPNDGASSAWVPNWFSVERDNRR